MMNWLNKLLILILLILVIQSKKTDYNKKINRAEKKIANHDHPKYIATQEFNNLSSDNFTARSKQADLVSKNNIADFVKKTDFDNKLISFNKRITKRYRV